MQPSPSTVPLPGSDAPRDPRVLLGCAGWSLSSAVAEDFPGEGSHLQRYAKVLPAVEINSSFYRPHRPATYARWRDNVPANFRFSAKLPRSITHEQKLQDVDELLASFLTEVGELGEKLGCLLVQLPPSLSFDASIAQAFFAGLRARTDTGIACEARHASWFCDEAALLLSEHGVASVEADPPPVSQAHAQGDADIAYIRLHGSPKVYYSAYADEVLNKLASTIAAYRQQGKAVWCIFDNTAQGHALPDALRLKQQL
ncbi:DUF72 domain-containing protein [Pigmentiphaga aceris]|uniref:DUF72 domain-containing protein n=1 Tax=Pigmentiphaga aceris TaxID=1940612 RepID=A0A5C0ATU3_9BURK|nr:DUF72 domain-containing protein [Pigmentiphaga aceris]QEI05708.1 DUF72 domain-containing protein [Pigmentiphaga aceris]